jgi:hypothetical protein
MTLISASRNAAKLWCLPPRASSIPIRNLMPQDQFYIKRLVVLPGEQVQIGDDRHLRHQRPAAGRRHAAF